MTSTKNEGVPKPVVSRSTLRLTLKTSEKGFELVSVERLGMITPPQIGERPEAGRHGGHWVELRDAEGRALAHRLLDPSLLDSTEVHDPSGKLARHFGSLRDGTLEVLLPDVAGADHVVLVGSPLQHSHKSKQTEHSRELARFDLSPALRGAGQ